MSDEAAGEVGPGQASGLPQGSQSALQQCDRHLQFFCSPQLTGLEFTVISR